MILLTMGLKSDQFSDLPFKTQNFFKMMKSAFQIPHHVAIRIFVAAAPHIVAKDRRRRRRPYDFPHETEKG